MIHIPSKFVALCICTLLAAIILPTVCAKGQTVGTVDVKIMEKETVGKYLADGKGVTLYQYARDGKDSSNCIEGCAINWPPFHTDPAAVGKGLEKEDFAVITRSDGRKQTTYKGMPLYYFKNDKYPGDTFGQGIGNVWFLVIPE
jgi:predicted lipoprotein with Yx(FWY)xxD motif